MHRRFLLLGSLALLAVSCGGSNDDDPVATDPPAADAPAATEPATTEPATTESSEPPATETAALIPEVVCVMGSDVHFAYDNQGSAPVVVDGDDNQLSGDDDEYDEPYVPTVFAPGRVSPVFVAAAFNVATEVEWALTGPDGTTRTAAPDADTPECTDDLLEPTTPDPRTPALEVVGITLDPAGDEVTVELELTGVPPTSVCNEAFDPDPAVIELRDGFGDASTEGTTATFTAPVTDFPPIGRVGDFRVVAAVTDRCSFDGTTFSAWPGGEFDTLLQVQDLCISVAGAEPEVVEGPCGPRIAPTGGTRNRG
jgi:hypothetical protein